MSPLTDHGLDESRRCVVVGDEILETSHISLIAYADESLTVVDKLLTYE